MRTSISESEAKAADRFPPAGLKSDIVREAHRLGFDIVRFTRPDAAPEARFALDRYLAEGRHGDMLWMAANADRRRSPRALWPEAETLIMLGLNYGAREDPLAALARRSHGAISVYARGEDYHDLIRARLKRLAAFVASVTDAAVKVFVDTAPLMEKPLAAAAGIGWQGKHTNLVSREFGSWLFLGSVLTTARIEPDAAEPDHCGGCTRCLDVCPTEAFPAPYQLDARRCISYLTIEHKGHIPSEFRAPIGNRVFGCDDCLAVCPWNKFAQAGRESRLAAREADLPPIAELLGLDDADFRLRFRGTPIKRTGRDRFLRNVLIAAGNSGDAALIPGVAENLDDGSPLVRAMAVWALGRLAGPELVSALRRQREPSETDADVKLEWARPGQEDHTTMRAGGA